ncbi:MAG: tRNA adenosine(34) deaminase TadA [Pseudomonadales bacterium]
MTAGVDEHWMRKALTLAEAAAEQGEVPVGALVVQGQNVLGVGMNQPILASDPTAHAELVALRDACERVGNYRLPGATLYVTVEPCTMCAGALVHARIERLVYGAPEPKAGAVHSSAQVLANPALNHRIAVSAGVLAEPAADLLRQFFLERRQRASKPGSAPQAADTNHD